MTNLIYAFGNEENRLHFAFVLGTLRAAHGIREELMGEMAAVDIYAIDDEALPVVRETAGKLHITLLRDLEVPNAQ